MHLLADYPRPLTYDETWGRSRTYQPANQGQSCHSSDWTGWEHGRTPCKQPAVVVIGGWMTGHHLGFCPQHWEQFKTVIVEEMQSTSTDEHWLIQAAIENLGEWVKQSAIDERDRLIAAERAAFWRPRTLTTQDRALADGLTDGQRVYFIQAGKRGPIKIGVARNIRKRLDALQTASPYRLRLRASVFGDERTEAAYHRMFDEHRMSGEWFKPARAIRTEIDTINRVKRRGEGALF